MSNCAFVRILVLRFVIPVGERSMQFQKNSYAPQDLSRRCISTRGESVSMYPRRPKAEAFENTVDVVELLLAPTDQVPNVRHLRVLHTFSSMTAIVLLIQQGVEEVDELCQHDGMVMVMVK